MVDQLQLIRIEVDEKSLNDAKALLFNVRYGIEDALRISANKTAATGKSRVSRRVQDVVNLPINKEIRPRIKVIKARYGNTTSFVLISRKPIQLIKYPYLVAPLIGVSVEMQRSKRQIFRHAFKATMPTGHTGLFERRYYTGGIPVRRLPIGQGPVTGKTARSEMVGPSIGLIFDRNGGDQVTEDLSDVFAKNLTNEVNRLLSK